MLKDIASQLETETTLNGTISTNTITPGSDIDTADFGEGLFVSAALSTYNDGDYRLSFEESDDAGVSDPYVEVAPEKLIGDQVVFSGDFSVGDILPKLGVFSTKRYVRVIVISENVTLGTNCLVLLTKKREILPNP